MDQRFFDKYKNIKEKFNYTYKGYNLKYLIPGYLSFVFGGDALSGRDVFKEFYTNTQVCNFDEAFRTDSRTLITYLIERADYKELALATQKRYPESEVICLSELPVKKISYFSWGYIKHFWLAVWLILKNSIGQGFKEKFYFIALTIKIMNQIQALEKTSSPPNIKTYISFNSAYREEALLTEYFKKKGAETITMQHGIFCNFRLLVPFDIINWENMNADKLLCWGQSTIDFMVNKGMDSSRFILKGNLKYQNLSLPRVQQTFKNCLVFLGRGLYIDTNNKLLELLTEFNKKTNNSIRFYVKKHPFLMDQEHIQFANIGHNMIFLGKEHSTQEVLKSDLVDFSIAVNTTAYYESLALGKPCLRWTEAENEDFYGMDDKFDSISSFEEKIVALQSMPQSDIRKEIESVIKYIFNPFLNVE